MLPLSENALDEMVARERERGAPPLTDWSSLSARLRAEGLMQTASSSSRFMSRGMDAGSSRPGAGRWRRGCRSNDCRELSDSRCPQQTAAVVTPSSSQASCPFRPSRIHQRSDTDCDARIRRCAPSRLPRKRGMFSTDQARSISARPLICRRRDRAAPMPTEPAQYRTRLAALDNVMNDMRGALKEAPHDPVINQYYRATVGVREATLRQLGTTLPAGAKLNRY